MTDSEDIQYLKGVGPRLGTVLKKLGIHTLTDAITFFPRDYEDRRHLPKIRSLFNPSFLNKTVTIVGTVTAFEDKATKGQTKVFSGQIVDETGDIQVVWFNQGYLKKQLNQRPRVILKGKVEHNAFSGRIQLTAMSTEVIKSPEDLKRQVNTIIPIYPSTQKLSQAKIRDVVQQSLMKKLGTVTDPFPTDIKIKWGLLEKRETLLNLHQPQAEKTFIQARYRMAFEEFFIYQLRLLFKKKNRAVRTKSPSLKTKGAHIDAFHHLLPYTLTKAQERVIQEVYTDLKKTTSMNRLVQGDVGSGKTDVAIATLLCAIESNLSAAIMAPTEVLVMQHYLKIKTIMSKLDVPVVLLKGKMKAKEKREMEERLKMEQAMIVIGTHALVQEHRDLPQLGVAIIDEQHRFGVMQRMILKQKGVSPHCLYLTATPIPRSFMLTCFGDLDKSIIDEMPPGRTPVTTQFIRQENFQRVLSVCQSRLDKGEQLYVVYPLVEESEKLDLQSALEGIEEIQAYFPQFKVDVLHGKMKPDQKVEIMTRFKEALTQILVSTTVIEVGIDVPNATMMIINHVERFGLSQLHQLRGRVGRGQAQSMCYLVGSPKTPQANQRIHAMLTTTDGFKISEYDLKIRGPGDMLGTKQSGMPDFKCANLVSDEAILIKAKKAADELLDQDPQLDHPKWQALKTIILSNNWHLLQEQLN